MTHAATSGEATISASMPLRTVDVIGVNVHAVFREALPGKPSVLLTAHFDGVGDDPQLRHPGGCDNASGVAAVIEAAHRLSTMDNHGFGLAVALLDGEEAGGHGSAHHASRLAPGTLVVNLDGAGALHEAAAVEAGGPAHALPAALKALGDSADFPHHPPPVETRNRHPVTPHTASVPV